MSKYEKIILQGISIVNEKIGQPTEKFHIENICFWLIPFSIWWWFISDHHFILVDSNTAAANGNILFYYSTLTKNIRYIY